MESTFAVSVFLASGFVVSDFVASGLVASGLGESVLAVVAVVAGVCESVCAGVVVLGAAGVVLDCCAIADVAIATLEIVRKAVTVRIRMEWLQAATLLCPSPTIRPGNQA
jgi:hypothetical protein